MRTYRINSDLSSVRLDKTQSFRIVKHSKVLNYVILLVISCLVAPAVGNLAGLLSFYLF